MNLSLLLADSSGIMYHFMLCHHLKSCSNCFVLFCFICRGPVHKERRNYLRTALKEMSLILSDQPGLLGPKVGFHFLGMMLPVSLYVEYTVFTLFSTVPD